MECFKCSTIFQSVNHLVLHYKHNHNLGKNDLYKCIIDDCRRMYNNLNLFRKHLNAVHGNKMTCITVEQEMETSNTIHIETSTTNAEISTTVIDPNLCNLESSQFSEIDINKNVSILISNLYANPLLSRKCVQFVVQNISTFLEYTYLPAIKDKLKNEFKQHDDSVHISREKN